MREQLHEVKQLHEGIVLLAVLSAGLGACAAIIDGKTVGEILPFYLMSFLGLYLYFSISGLVDLEGKKELLKISLTDFLENHMAPRLAILEESEMLAGGKPDRRNPGSRAAENTKTEVKKSADPEAVAAFAFTKEPETGEAEGTVQTVAEGKSAAQKRMEEQFFSKTQEKELEELLKEFFA